MKILNWINVYQILLSFSSLILKLFPCSVYNNGISSNLISSKELSGGKIDLSRSGFLVQSEALKCIHFAIQSQPQGEPINSHEETWIESTHKGGLRYIKNDITLEHGYEYDIRGSYAFQLSNPKFTFPINQGVFTFIEEIPEIVKYGIYRVVIEESDDYFINRLFKFNAEDLYTHYDIYSARLLNLKMTNALFYEKGRASGHQYFGGTVNQLNKLKMKVANED